MSNSNPENNHPYIEKLRKYGEPISLEHTADIPFDLAGDPTISLEPDAVGKYKIINNRIGNDIVTVLNLGKDKSVTYQLALGDGVPTTILTTELTDEGKPQYGEKFLTNDTLKLLVELFPHYAPYLTEVNEV